MMENSFDFIEVSCTISIEHQHVFTPGVESADLDCSSLTLIDHLSDATHEAAWLRFILGVLLCHFFDVLKSTVLAAVID